MLKITADKSWMNQKDLLNLVGITHGFRTVLELKSMPPLIAGDEEKGYEFCKDYCRELREHGFVPVIIFVRVWKNGMGDLETIKIKWFIEIVHKEGADPRKVIPKCRGYDEE